MADQVADTVKPILEGFVEGLKHRLGSPLLFGFLLSWCAFNYKFLLVLLAEDPFKRKFDFIDKNINLHWLVPFFIAALLTSIPPIFEIPYAAFRAVCKNIERKWVLAVEKKTPMDRDEQILAFSEKDNEVAKLKADIDKLNTEYSNLSRVHILRAAEINLRLEASCLLYLAHGSNLNANEVKNILNGGDQSDPIVNKFVPVFAQSPMRKFVIGFIHYVESLSLAEEMRIDPQDLQRSVNIPDTYMSFYLDILRSIGFLAPGNIGGLVVCPYGSLSYSIGSAFLKSQFPN